LDEFVGVFDEFLLPKGVRVGEIDFCIELSGDIFMFG
jgi:hypothetical protein